MKNLGSENLVIQYNFSSKKKVELKEKLMLTPLGLRGGEISPPPVHDSMLMVLWIANLGKILSKKF